jgi:hypothetical protein
MLCFKYTRILFRNMFEVKKHIFMWSIFYEHIYNKQYHALR